MVQAERRYGARTSHFAHEMARLAGRISWDSLPEDALVRARHCLLDWLGVTLAGSGEPLSRILRDEAMAEGASGRATIVGTSERAGIRQAALLNGSASHALDFDDVHTGMSGHPTVPVLPAVLALAESRGEETGAVLAAFVAGVEVECRLSAALPGHYQDGWHATGTLGTFGAAAACSHLLGLDEERFAHALGIAGAQAAGLKSMFGTMCKPLHAGKAAENGLLAATLAARGFTSNPAVFEAHQGFASTHARGFDPARALAESDRLAIQDVIFKYHAACFGTHATIEALLRMKERASIPTEAVESVELRVPEGALSMCNIAQPSTALEGKFSLRFTAALALGRDDTSEAAFTDDAVEAPDLVALRDRVTVHGDATVGGGETTATVELADGRRLTERVDVNLPEGPRARGSAVGVKVSLAGIARHWGNSQARELAAAVRGCGPGGGVVDLLALTAPGGS